MAARQDQGLLASLIVFVILFLVSFVAAYIGWKSYGDSQQQVAELKNQLGVEQTAVRNSTDVNQDYKRMMGFGEQDNADDVQTTFDQDMERFGASFAGTSRAYRNILEYVDKENESIAARETSAKEQVKQLKDRLIAIEAEKDVQIARALDARKQAEDDLKAERKKFGEDRERLEQTEGGLQETLSKQRIRYEAEIAKLEATIKDRTGKLAASERAVAILLPQVPGPLGSFEVADGRVSWVNQNGTLWINLGSADSLREQVTFSVFNADQHDAGKAEKKGSIEVTRILGDHLAEAAITEDDVRNPILSGDQIYSQVWHRGKKLRFALTGIIDVDDDRQSDLGLVRNLVELNGGIVDAYLDEDGKVEGELTVNTRYLVLGKFPGEANQAGLVRGWNDMSEEANRKGVETITLDMFLNQMGYSPNDRVVRLGSGARAGDLPSVPAPGSSRFRPRSPVRSGRPTPY